MSWRSSSADKAPSTTAPAPSEGRLNAKDFGAVGDGKADDTAALQRAVDAAQLQGKALYVPGGSYALSRPLLVHCSNAFCTTGFSTNITYRGLSMSGAGEFLTTLFASASAPRLESIHGLCLLAVLGFVRSRLVFLWPGARAARPVADITPAPRPANAPRLCRPPLGIHQRLHPVLEEALGLLEVQNREGVPLVFAHAPAAQRQPAV